VRGHAALLFVLAWTVGCRTAAPPSAESARAAGQAGDVAAAPSGGCRRGDLPVLVGAARELTVDGATRRYLIDAAAGAADAPRPLVLAFHGFRHSAAGLRAGLGFVEHAAAGELIAIHADGRDDVQLLDTVGRGWDIAPDDTRDTAFVTAILDAVEQERCVDRRRIYATGFSNGGFFSNLLGCRLADRLAAVAAVSGARPLDACRPAAPIPILFFHGTADPIVPPRLTVGAAAWWRRANRCGEGDEASDGCQAARDCAADVVVCTGPQAHTWPSGATDRIWEFFRRHPRRE
jgi:polyhydroxybutyrate depolymerase